MRFDALPAELFLKIANACGPNELDKLRFTNTKFYGLWQKYLNETKVTEIAFETFEDKQSLSVKLVTPDRVRLKGPFMEGTKVTKKNREMIKKITYTESLTIKGYHILSMFKEHNDTISLKAFKKLEKVETLVLEGCPIEYSSDILNKIATRFRVEHLEIGGFNRIGTALSAGESIKVLDVFPGNIHIPYYRNTTSDFDDEFLKKLSSKPRRELSIGSVDTLFTFAAVLRTIKEVLLKGWKVDWNLGFIRIMSTNDFKKFQEHRSNLIAFVKINLNMELKCEMVNDRENEIWHLEYRFTVEEKDICFTFSTDDCCKRTMIYFDPPFRKDYDVFIGNNAVEEEE